MENKKGKEAKMDILKDEQLSEYFEIYQKRELTKQEETRYKKIKKEIEKLMEVPIEKMFLIGENAWGKTRNDEMEILFIVIDKRFKDLEREEKILAEYSDANNISFILTSLCRYEKRKKLTTEKEYFVENFGIKIYDSEKQPSINEGIAETEYASAMKGFKSFRRYISSPAILMEDLLRIYILKLGAPVNKHKSDFKSEVKIAKMISTDEEGIKLIDEFIQEKIIKFKKKYVKNSKNIYKK